eukprot:844587-Amphidinium_carterae.1
MMLPIHNNDGMTKTKTTPVTSKEAMGTTGAERETWRMSIQRELDGFRSSHAMEFASRGLVAGCFMDRP